jgi:AraC family transcriptional regulator of arabinose operon
MEITTMEEKIKEGFLGQSVLIVTPAKQRQLAAHPFCRSLYATAIGYYPLASYHDRERENGCGDYILLYCIDGHGYVEEQGQRTLLNPSSFYILPKNSQHHYGSIAKKPWSIYWLHFNGEQANLLFQRYAESTHPNVLKYDRDRIDRFNYLLSTLGNDLTQMNMDMLYLNLLTLITSFTHLKGDHKDFPDDSVSRTIQFMKDNVNENFKIKELADMSNYSVTRFSQLFKARTGYAPMQYVLHLKIQGACQYLSFSKMNIKEIAQTLGFLDPFYFSRIFKVLTGKSPLNYRKTNENAAGKT